jgi:hypothetical protein
LDSDSLERMASGHLCLPLSRTVPWESFPDYAETVLVKIRAEKLEVYDSVVERIWLVAVDGVSMYLAYDDDSGVSLESMNDEGDAVLRRLAVWIKIGVSTD